MRTWRVDDIEGNKSHSTPQRATEEALHLVKRQEDEGGGS